MRFYLQQGICSFIKTWEAFSQLGVLTTCYGAINIGIPTAGTIHTIKCFGVNAAGTGSIFMDGIFIRDLLGISVPTNTTRIHTVGTGTYGVM